MWQDTFDDESGGIYYTMPGTGEVSWTRPASLDINDPADMTEDELRALIIQAGWEDSDVDDQNLLALGQEALAAIVAQEVAATYDATEWEDPGDAPPEGGSGDQWEDPGIAPPDGEGRAVEWEDPGNSMDGNFDANNDWNEGNAVADGDPDPATAGAEWVGESDGNGNDENGDAAAALVEETPYWIEKFDDDSGAPYYVNSSSGEVVWEIPLDESTAVDQTEEEGYGNATAEAGNASAGTEPGNDWTELWDDETSAVYYQHNTTGEFMWETPWQTPSPIDTQMDNIAVPDAALVDNTGEATASFEEAGTTSQPSAVVRVSPAGSGPVAARSLRYSVYSKQTSSSSGSRKVSLSPINSSSSIIPRLNITKSDTGSAVSPSPHYSKALKPLHLEQPLKDLDKGSLDSDMTSFKIETPQIHQ